MSTLQVSARIKLHGDRPKDLKELAEQCVERVRQRDSGTLQYDWFYNRDQKECVVRETYTGSEALLAHLDHLGDLLEELNQIGSMSVELYGDPSAELLEALQESDVTTYEYLEGL